MAKEKIVLESESILGGATQTSRMSSDVDSAFAALASDFQGLGSLIPGVVGQIKKQSAGISRQLASYSNEVKTNVNAGIEYDSKIASLAEDIDIPLDFTANNSMDTNKYNAVFLHKGDGKSVNEGNETKKVNEIDDSTVAAQGIFDMRGETAKEEKYDDTTIIGKSVLGNISGDQTKAQTYDDSTSVGNTKLGNIAGDQTQKQDYDASSNLTNKSLGNISGDQTQKQDYNVNSNLTNKSLGNISGDQTQKQTYDDSTVLGQSVLGSIYDAETQAREIDDDVIAAIMKEAEEKMNERKNEFLPDGDNGKDA